MSTLSEQYQELIEMADKNEHREWVSVINGVHVCLDWCYSCEMECLFTSSGCSSCGGSGLLHSAQELDNLLNKKD